MFPILVAFSGVFALGIIFSILGSVKLQLAEVLKIDDAKVGNLISALMFSCLVAVLIIGPLTDLLGYQIIALIGFILGGICVWLLASAASYGAALGACLMLGVAAMSVNTVGNTLGATILFNGEDPARASNVLNVFFGIGAFVTPLILAFLLGVIGYKKTVMIIGAILFLPVIIVLLAWTSLPSPDEGFVITSAVGLLANPAVLVGGLALFCYIALESSMAGFVTTYLKSHHFSDKAAGTILSAFWIGLVAARLIAAIFLVGIDPAMVVPVLAVVAAVAIGIMVVAPTPVVGVVGTVLAGLALGPIFPTLVGVSFAKTDAIAAGTAGSVFGLIFAIGLLGGIIVPRLIGKYAVEMSIRQSLKIALGVAVALVVVSAALWIAVPNVEAKLVDEPALVEVTPPVIEEPIVVAPVDVEPIEVEEAADAIAEEVTEAAEAAPGALEEVVTEAVEALEDTVEAIEEAIEEVAEAVEAAAEEAPEE